MSPPRRGNLVNLEWSDLLLDINGEDGFLTFDTTKSGRDAKWVLDPGTAEALRRWRRICPSTRYVFPELAVPTKRKLKRRDRPMYVEHLGPEMRRWLKEAGVDREKLFQKTENRIPLRGHDLRATFVTIALANGKSEAWVTQRTGHTTSAMLARYKRDADSIAELKLGWFEPLHEAIPELAEMGSPRPVEVPSGEESSENRRTETSRHRIPGRYDIN